FETDADAKSPNDAPLPPDAFYWKLEEETVIIQGLRDKTTPSVVVPHEIAGRPVVEIETLAFDNAELMQLILPKQLKKIGRAAFKDCSNLQRVAIPDGVEKIASWAFAGCASLTEVVIPQSVVVIENNVFDLCFSLEKISVDARNSAYRDVDGALLTRDNANFIRCPQAKRGKFAVPRGARRIHEAAFEHCRLLTEVIIPDSVEEFSNDLNRARFKTPFYDCRSLTTIRVAPENPRFRDVDGVILSRDFKTLYFFPQGKSGEYLVPASVEKIAENAFTGCARLNRVVVGRNVKTIEAGAFSSCSVLTQIVLPKRLKIIKRRLFFDCPALTQVALPDELQEIDKEAFARCGALSQIVLPPNVAKIKANAFYDCSSLTKVLFNEALKEIGDCAFHNCVSLTRLEFPSSLQSVGKSAFCGCSHLTEIVFSDCAPMSPCPTFTEIVELEKHAASLDLFRRIANAARSGFVFTFFPNVWLKISAFAFYACSSLRCAHLSNAVYEIGVNAFANCDKLSD
ncbi:MAG: leucine-rich repeat domain-containing protein, partial [Thermoguttaceae bacterium]|nr:leucine-rich repeat domain-containing protein [Thermoguttaceae bacterium]